MGNTASSTASHAAPPPPTSNSRSVSTDIPSDNPSVSVHNNMVTGSGRRQQRSKENCAGSGSGDNSDTSSNKLGEESVLFPNGGSSHNTSSCEDNSPGKSSPLAHTEATTASLTNSASSSSSTMKLLHPLLYLLGPVARRFLVSQGITTVDAFLALDRNAMEGALFEWRKREKLEERMFASAMNEVQTWKREVLQRQKTRKEKPVGLHITFEVFDPTVRSFLAAQSIATPSDLRHSDPPTLALEFFYWGKEKQGMKEIKLTSAREYISMWRESVERQGMRFPETLAATSPPVELLGDSVVSHDDAAEATTPYKANSETLGMTAHVSPAEESAAVIDPRGVPIEPSQKTHSAADTHVHESGVEKEPTRIEIAANAHSLIDHPVKTCAPMNTVADCADPQALAVAVVSKNVQESENDTVKMNPTAESALEFDSSGKGHAFEKTIGIATVIQPSEVVTEKKLTKDATTAKAIGGYGVGSGGGSTRLGDKQAPASSHQVTESGQSAESIQLDPLLDLLDATTAKAIGGYGVGSGGGSTRLGDKQAPASSHQVTESGQSAESIQLDPLLDLLGPLASRFLLSQGITTVDAFLTSENKPMALALLELREREKLKKRAYNTVMNEVKNWKRELQQRQETRKEKPLGLHIAFEVLDPTVRSYLASQSIATPSDLRLTNGPALARSYNNWRTQQGMINLKWSSSEKCVSMWRESVERQSMRLAETSAATLPPTEAQQTQLGDSMICSDDVAEVTTPCKLNNETLGMTAHVSHAEETTFAFDPRRVHVVHRKNTHSAADTQVPESSVEKEPTRKKRAANAISFVDPLAKTYLAPINTVAEDPLLYLLGPLVRRFLLSQGITIVDTFLTSENKPMAIALIQWRKREKLEERAYNTVMNELRNWKREVQQRQETRKEKPVGLHIAFEVFDPTVPSFLASQSIATPSDLRLGHRATLARFFINWRKEKGMKEIPLSSAKRGISMWKESVERQSMGLAGTTADLRPLPEPQEPKNDTMKMNTAAKSALIFDPLGMGRATEKATAITATDIQPSEVRFENEDADISTIRTAISRKETIGYLSSCSPIETTADSASTDAQEQGLANGVIPDSQRKRAQDESTETRRVEPSRKKLRYTVFWV
jgi:hypothetical protein